MWKTALAQTNLASSKSSLHIVCVCVRNVQDNDSTYYRVCVCVCVCVALIELRECLIN